MSNSNNKIKAFFRKIKLDGILAAIALVAVGVLFLLFPENSVKIICYAIGIIFIILGVIELALFFLGGLRTTDNRLVIGAAFLCVGILCLVRRDIVQETIALICGVILILDALFKLQQAIARLKRKMQSGIAYLIVSVVYFIHGIVILVSPFAGRSLGIFIGISLVIEGVCDILLFALLSTKERREKNAVKPVHEVQEESISAADGENEKKD